MSISRSVFHSRDVFYTPPALTAGSRCFLLHDGGKIVMDGEKRILISWVYNRKGWVWLGFVSLSQRDFRKAHPTSVAVGFIVTHFGRMSHPWPMMDPIVNQMQLCMFQIFSSSSASWLQGWLASQSSGAMLVVQERREKKEKAKTNLHNWNFRWKGWRRRNAVFRCQIFTVRGQTASRRPPNKPQAWKPKHQRSTVTEMKTNLVAA